MTDGTLTREDLQEELQAALLPVLQAIAIVQQDVTGVRADLATIERRLAAIEVKVDGLPLVNRAVTVLQQESRSLKAAFNNFALTNPTKGEIEALHDDVNRVQAENAELAAKVATLERLVRELQR